MPRIRWFVSEMTRNYALISKSCGFLYEARYVHVHTFNMVHLRVDHREQRKRLRFLSMKRHLHVDTFVIFLTARLFERLSPSNTRTDTHTFFFVLNWSSSTFKSSFISTETIFRGWIKYGVLRGICRVFFIFSLSLFLPVSSSFYSNRFAAAFCIVNL